MVWLLASGVSCCLVCLVQRVAQRVWEYMRLTRWWLTINTFPQQFQWWCVSGDRNMDRIHWGHQLQKDTSSNDQPNRFGYIKLSHVESGDRSRTGTNGLERRRRNSQINITNYPPTTHDDPWPSSSVRIEVKRRLLGYDLWPLNGWSEECNTVTSWRPLLFSVFRSSVTRLLLFLVVGGGNIVDDWTR